MRKSTNHKLNFLYCDQENADASATCE